MRYLPLLLIAMIGTAFASEQSDVTVKAKPAAETTVICATPSQPETSPCESCVKEPVTVQRSSEPLLSEENDVHIAVYGQGVAPMTTTSPAQAYALAKRAAIADAYRLIAEKVKGVRVEGQDTIKNMIVKRSMVRTNVDAMVRRANIVETTFKDGLCEVEMEIVLSHSQFTR